MHGERNRYSKEYRPRGRVSPAIAEQRNVSTSEENTDGLSLEKNEYCEKGHNFPTTALYRMDHTRTSRNKARRGISQQHEEEKSDEGRISGGIHNSGLHGVSRDSD